MFSRDELNEKIKVLLTKKVVNFSDLEYYKDIYELLLNGKIIE